MSKGSKYAPPSPTSGAKPEFKAPGLPPPPPKPMGGTPKKIHDYSPLPWSDFFDSKQLIDDKIPLYIGGTKGPIFICIHGAGHSALSFCAFAKEMKDECRVAAFDFRGHGEHFDENEKVLSEEILLKEAETAITYIADANPEDSLVILGHSLGGAIAAKVTASMINHSHHSADQIKALVVIDVVEGSAMDALPMMEAIVNSRPKKFQSLEAAIEWNLKSGTVRNLLSARVSTQALLIQTTDPITGLQYYKWRTDLIATKVYWEAWFKGLTSAFLSIRLPKELVLAGSDRMDKDMTIAQMQGKFRLEIVPNVGHVIHEDNPKKLAISCKELITIFKIGEKAFVPSVITSLGGKQVIIGGKPH